MRKPLYDLQMSEVAGGEREQCDHFGCQKFGGREEYCEIRGRDGDADIAVVSQYLDEILFSNIDVSSTAVAYRTDENGSYLRRQFDLLSSDGVHWVWPLIATTIVVSRSETHLPEKVSYEIETQWTVHQPVAKEKLPYQTSYSLELWNTSAQATMTDYEIHCEAPDKVEAVPVERPMTPYDYKMLFDLLGEVEAMQKGAAAESPTI